MSPVRPEPHHYDRQAKYLGADSLSSSVGGPKIMELRKEADKNTNMPRQSPLHGEWVKENDEALAKLSG